MSEETSDHGAPPTERLLNALKEAGVDLENPDVIKAIEITSDFHFEVMGQFRSVADRAMKSANRSIDISRKSQEQFEELHQFSIVLKDREKSLRRKYNIIQWIIFSVGIISAIFSMSIRAVPTHGLLDRIIHWASWLIIFPVALAQSSNTGAAGGLPDNFIRYAVYGILLLSHVAGMVAWFWGPPSVRKPAGDYVKNLTTFFIGTASGKVL